jgi:hypothetical protein
MNHKPASMEAMHFQSEIAILGVIKRLKEYAKQPHNAEMQCDLDIAANVLMFLLKMNDDFK